MKLDNYVSQLLGWGLICSAMSFAYLSTAKTNIIDSHFYGAMYIFCYAAAGLIFTIRHLKNKE